mmetsp:Transcript_16622/g.44551  ORF Transcript_16622/g.44551 Transcript_16622/m.44551 type:complete len:234 (-) Transcript_16622:188-889(-)
MWYTHPRLVMASFLPGANCRARCSSRCASSKRPSCRNRAPRCVAVVASVLALLRGRMAKTWPKPSSCLPLSFEQPLQAEKESPESRSRTALRPSSTPRIVAAAAAGHRRCGRQGAASRRGRYAAASAGPGPSAAAGPKSRLRAPPPPLPPLPPWGNGPSVKIHGHSCATALPPATRGLPPVRRFPPPRASACAVACASPEASTGLGPTRLTACPLLTTTAMAMGICRGWHRCR